MALSTLEILVGMRELLAEESRWTKGDYAVDALGLPIEPASPDACQWCLLGAWRKLTGLRDNSASHDGAVLALRRAIEAHDGFALAEWNDSRRRKHAEVLAALDRAIDLERGQA